jgi:hypothetical protein
MLGVARVFGAARAFLQVRAEPIVVGWRDAFDAFLCDELFGACMDFLTHTAPP